MAYYAGSLIVWLPVLSLYYHFAEEINGDYAELRKFFKEA